MWDAHVRPKEKTARENGISRHFLQHFCANHHALPYPPSFPVFSGKTPLFLRGISQADRNIQMISGRHLF